MYVHMKFFNSKKLSILVVGKRKKNHKFNNKATTFNKEQFNSINHLCKIPTMPYYGVTRGFNVGVYTNWPACKAQVNGASGATFRKFETIDEAWHFVFHHYMRQGTYGVFQVQVVYIDGACRGNGNKYNSSAGYGVFYGRNNPRNVANPLDLVDRHNDYRPTNQRAELYALCQVLVNIVNDINAGNCRLKTEIRTDSMFVINSITTWCYKWCNNGWINAKGDTVANVDLLQKNFNLMKSINKEYEDRGWGDIEFIHVRGHSGDYGNDEADRLANLGADRYGNYI